MLKTVSDSNYKALLQHKTKVDAGISRIDQNIKKPYPATSYNTEKT